MNGDGSCRAYSELLWLLTIHDYINLYAFIYIVHGCDMEWDHDMGHNEAINPSISSRSAESAISSPCLGTLANDGSWSMLLLLTTMLYIAISCWDMLRLLSIYIDRVFTSLFRWLLGTPWSGERNVCWSLGTRSRSTAEGYQNVRCASCAKTSKWVVLSSCHNEWECVEYVSNARGDFLQREVQALHADQALKSPLPAWDSGTDTVQCSRGSWE